MYKTLLNSGQVSAQTLRPVFDDLFDFLYMEYARKDHWQLIPGSAHVIKALSQEWNCQLGVISNNDERVGTCAL